MAFAGSLDLVTPIAVLTDPDEDDDDDEGAGPQQNENAF